jgi:hypothetical protein
MQDGIKVRKIIQLGVTHVLANHRRGTDITAAWECATSVEIAIKANDLMSCLNQHWR